MKATTLLEKQHRKVETIFKKLEGGRSEPGPLLEELASSLAAHMAIEQDIFYPAIRSVKKDLVAESFEEHAVAELALKRLLAAGPEHPSFKAKVITLKELIEHHVKEEEEELFPAVEKAVKEDTLLDLGVQMKRAFDEAVEVGFTGLVPKSMASTSADAANKPSKAKPATKANHASARA